MTKLMSYFIPILFFFACAEKTPQESNNQKESAYTFIAPNGSEVLPAERGPVRDVFEPPPVNLETFQLLVDGHVQSPLSLSWQKIKDMNSVATDTLIMYCVEGWEVWGVWRGISIPALLDRVKPQDNATHIMFHGIDGYTTAMPITFLNRYNAMLAYEVNGQPLRKHDGYPLRLVAFGLYGYKWAKYVTRLEIIDAPKLGFWERYGYADKAIVPLQRRQFYEGDDAGPIEY